VNAQDAEWVAVALLGKTRGNRGELTAIAFSDKPDRYQDLDLVYLFGPGDSAGRPHHVESAWFHNGVLILKFRGVDTISDAQSLSGSEVRVPISQRTPLEAGEFFHSDIVGCSVIDRATGETLGVVRELQDAGGPGLLVLENGMMIPFAKSICVEIDPASRRIVVELPEGLKDLNQ
jgi:16S rRNA processing protein RimM